MKYYRGLFIFFLIAFRTTYAQQWDSGGNNYTTGRLAIGSSAPPDARLSITAGQLVGLSISGNNSSFVGADLSIGRSNTLPGVGQGGTLQFNDPGSGNYQIIQGSSAGLQFFSIAAGGWYERMRISSSGNVGIGTTNPGLARLQIAGGSLLDNAIRLEQGKFSMNGDARFEIDSNGTLGGRLLIESDGRVGIGTTSPDERLTVKGTIHAHEVRVDAAANVVPDYVFEKDYNLQSLAEIEMYIHRNKHLPEVPSAKEMEENGLNLKEMNLILLRKIEELTLHVIELNKEIALLKQNNASPDLSGKKVEELTLHVIELKKEIQDLKENK